jgi:hypothetical protein
MMRRNNLEKSGEKVDNGARYEPSGARDATSLFFAKYVSLPSKGGRRRRVV